MRRKLAKWFVIAAAIGMVSAEEGGIPVPGYLAGLRPLTEKRIPMKQAVVERCSIDAILGVGEADVLLDGGAEFREIEFAEHEAESRDLR